MEPWAVFEILTTYFNFSASDAFRVLAKATGPEMRADFTMRITWAPEQGGKLIIVPVIGNSYDD